MRANNQHTRHSRFLALATVLLTLGLSACGDDKGAAPGSSVTGANSTLTYGYYVSAGRLMLYDPANPTVPPLQADAGPVCDVTPVMAGTWDAASRRVTDRHVPTLVYSAGGMLWSLDIKKTGTAPTPAQVSNQTGLTYAASITQLCSLGVYEDYAVHGNSQIVYSTAGADTSCTNADDVVQATTISARSVTAPMSPGTLGVRVVAHHFNMTTGALAGFLLQNATQIQHFAPTWAFDALILVGPTLNRVEKLPNGKLMLIVDDGVNVAHRLYDPALAIGTGNPSAALLTVPSVNAMALVNDSSNLFVGDFTAFRIYRLPIDGTPAVTLIDEGLNPAGATAGMDTLRLTANRVVYFWTDGTSNTLRSVSKTGTGLTDLATIAAASALGNGLYPASSRSDDLRYPGTKVFYNLLPAAGAFSACIVGESGDVPSCSGGSATSDYWSGWNTGTTAGLGSETPAVFIKQSDNGTSVKLTTVNAETGGALATLTGPTLLAAGVLVTPQAIANDHNAILLVAGTQTDIYHANTASADSLVRITNDATTEDTVGPAGCTLGHGIFDPLLPLLVLAASIYLFQRRRRKA